MTLMSFQTCMSFYHKRRYFEEWWLFFWSIQMEVNRNQNTLFANILQNILCSTDTVKKVTQVWNVMTVSKWSKFLFLWVNYLLNSSGVTVGQEITAEVWLSWHDKSVIMTSVVKLSTYFLLATKPLLTRWLDSHYITHHSWWASDLFFRSDICLYIIMFMCIRVALCVFVSFSLWDRNFKSKYKRNNMHHKDLTGSTNSNFFFSWTSWILKTYSNEAS